MPVTLQILDPSRSRLGPAVRRLLTLLKIKQGTWSIALVDDAQMAELHGRTLHLPTTTDVLTFDLREDLADAGGIRGPAPGLELETVICLDEARRRAGELGHPVRHELLLYCLHSLLHVQGYDDRTAADAARMHVREDELLEAAGIGRIYAPHRPPNAPGRKVAPAAGRRAGKRAPGKSRGAP